MRLILHLRHLRGEEEKKDHLGAFLEERRRRKTTWAHSLRRGGCMRSMV
jgi:hypothetical protein